MGARVGGVATGAGRLVLAASDQFMNESGIAAVAIVRRYLDGDEHRLVVVHDELDLPPGVVRVKVGGGTAGHNGLRSIEQHLKSLEFCRVRIGIGKPLGREGGVDHVLGRPGRKEAELLALGEELAVSALEMIVNDGVDKAMTEINQRR